MQVTPEQKERVADFFSSYQLQLIHALEQVDGKARFQLSTWDYQQGGGSGRMGVARGEEMEKAGVNFSRVWGKQFPSQEEKYKGKDFFATGISTITHMYNPHAPIGHMNVRLVEAGGNAWFGGGADLTPCFPYEEDTMEFHRALQKACDAYHPDAYAKYSKWCDAYFYIPHRKSARGVGGIFFDELDEADFESMFAFVQATAQAYLEVFPGILQRRKIMPFTPDEKEQQLRWRGRYVEFNLLYDRGTKFGLLSGGNTEAILVSLPPVVKW